MMPLRKPPGIASVAVPRRKKVAGRALDEHGRVVADERAADAVKVRRRA